MSIISKILLCQICAAILGFILDMLLGEPKLIPHPIVLIGKLIARLENTARRIVKSGSKVGEVIAGGLIWLIVCLISTAIPFAILVLCYKLSPVVGVIVEAVMCWLILATRSLKTESMRVYRALKRGDIVKARSAVSMIVGRDTDELDEVGVTKAAVETVAENTSDGSIAPLIYIMLGGAPLGFLYKAVNTMDSMLGYIDEPYTNIGFIPAKADDIFNFIPARITALMMLISGYVLGLDCKTGRKIFKRDRYKHASPNSAQTEAVCAGLINIQLAGDAYYRGVLHKKQFIGDPIRPIEKSDIKTACTLLYETALLCLLLFSLIKLSIFVATVI